jgi:hypothetical protein
MKRTIQSVIITLTLLSLALMPRAQAVSPAPDGDYEQDNTAEGKSALHSFSQFSRDRASNNSAIGYRALYSCKNSHGNTAVGSEALSNATATFGTQGSYNTGIGFKALVNNTTGNTNIGLGNSAGSNLTIGSNNIDIGNEGVAAEGNTIRIGNANQTKTFIAGISGAQVTGTTVQVNAEGQLGEAPSSERFKDAIKPMDNASKAILALKPVTFRYKKDIDPTGRSQFGLVAEEVEKVSPDLVVRDKDGTPYSVRYEAVNAMLLNEFLKEHQTVQELKKEVAALTAGLQKVSAQLEVSKAAPQTVLNNQ